MFAEPFDDAAVERMRGVGRVTCLESCDEQSLMRIAGDCDALLVRTRSNVTRRVIENGKRLRVIGRGGSGVDNIDIEAARERGVAVVYTPEASTEAVAELTIGLMIALLRGVLAGDNGVRGGAFAESRARCLGPELGELTVGIVGLGRIGKAVARRCRNGFGMTVVYNDIVEPGLLDFVASAMDKDALYAGADVVSLHVPLTAETKGLIDGATLAKFKHGAVLINTSRGAVVDGVALAEALAAGRLAGAALDVFDPEPLPADHPLLSAPNTLFTPHIGARTPGSLARMNAVVEDVVRVLEGQAPLYPAWP